MSSDVHPIPDPLDRYLDGALSGPELAAFEARLANEPELRSAVELQRMIDGSLRSSFAPRLIEMPASAPPAPLPFLNPARLRQIFGIAAVLILSVVVWRVYFPAPVQNIIEPVELFERLVQNGFQPEFVCTDDIAFGETVKQRVGSPLLVASASGLEILGWAYSDNYNGVTVSDKTLILLAKQNGEPVLVLMDRKANDRTLKVTPGHGVNVHRSTIGDVVLYEVTRSPEPQILGKVQMPKTWPPPKP